MPAHAWATGAQSEAQTSDEVSDLERKVQESASSYNEAVARQEELADQIDELDSKIGELEGRLPQQQDECNESIVALYKCSYDSGSVVQMLLDASSVTDMLALIDQYNWVIEHYLSAIEELAQTKGELESSRSQLEGDKAQADEAADEAASALASAKEARQKAAEEAAAKQKAEAEAAAKAAVEKKQEAEKKATAAEQAGDEQAKAQAQEEAAAAKSEEKAEEESSASASTANVDWSADKTAFVNEWASRIDDYLSSSPTAGTGTYYAAAAWEYGVDPRWAPAISCIESTKGAYCFRSHNAWGYGGSGFSSWEEGINTVVRGLGGSLYGGHLTQAAAQTYCPPTWQDWYANVSAEMGKI